MNPQHGGSLNGEKPIEVDVGILHERGREYEGKLISCWIIVNQKGPYLVNETVIVLQEREFNLIFVVNERRAQEIPALSHLMVRGLVFLASKGFILVTEWLLHPAGAFYDPFASILGLFVLIAVLSINRRSRISNKIRKFILRGSS